jgi:hypothetical protein
MRKADKTTETTALAKQNLPTSAACASAKELFAGLTDHASVSTTAS